MDGLCDGCDVVTEVAGTPDGRAQLCIQCMTTYPLTETCEACGADPLEPCRPGCLGYAIEHDELAGTEPCS